MLINKKGELATREILEIVLAGVVVFVLGFLFFKLLSPEFDVNDETAKEYFDSFMDAIEVVDSGKVGRFLMWQPEEEVGFYVVYFGGSRRVSKAVGENMKIIDFTSFGRNENHVCLCYVENEKSRCDYCENLRYPAVYGKIENWVIDVDERVEVLKKGGVYEIVRV